VRFRGLSVSLVTASNWCVGAVAYAEDILLLAPTAMAMKWMLHIHLPTSFSCPINQNV